MKEANAGHIITRHLYKLFELVCAVDVVGELRPRVVNQVYEYLHVGS
jgi:hypothetical protein